MHRSMPSAKRSERRFRVSISWLKTQHLRKRFSFQLPTVGNISKRRTVTPFMTGCSFYHRLQVNHLATAQLAILLLPLLLQTARSTGATPRLVFVSSAAHHFSPPLKSQTSEQGTLDWLNDQSKPMQARYPVSKLLNLFFARELASRLSEDSPLVINAVNPGFCISALRRNALLPRRMLHLFLETLISWSTERGSRQLIFAALGNQDKPDEMKGAYISSSEVAEPSDYVLSDEGARIQKQLWVRLLHQVWEFSPI